MLGCDNKTGAAGNEAGQGAIGSDFGEAAGFSFARIKRPDEKQIGQPKHKGIRRVGCGTYGVLSTPSTGGLGQLFEDRGLR